MANELSPEQEDDKSPLPPEDLPEFLRSREDLYKPGAKDSQTSGDAPDPGVEDKVSPGGLSKAEKDAAKPAEHENTVGAGYKAGAGEHHSAWHSRFTRTRKRKAALGGSIAALLVTGAIIGFLSLIPLKILHIVNNLQSRFYGTTQNAVEKETDQLFSRYVLGKMLKGCKGVYIDSSCNPYNGTSLVQKLYRGWSDGRLEEKLRTQTGLELRYNQDSKIYEMRFAGGDTIDLDGLKQNKTISELIDSKGDWSVVKKSEVKGVYKSAIKATTRQASAMYYFKVTPYLGKKFGVKWCVIGCDKREGFDKWKADKKFGAKMWLAERVLIPRSDLYTMILKCLYAPDALCKPDNVLKATPRAYSADVGGCKSGCIDGGRPVSPTLTEMESKLVALAANYGSDYTTLRKAFDLFEKSGFTKAVLGSAVQSINNAGKDRGEAELENNGDAIDSVNSEGEKRGVFKPVRVLGWAAMAAQIIQFINDSPVVVQRMQYMANTASMTQLWGMYRTAADEVKEGQTDAELLGSFVTSLGPGLQPTDPSATNGDAQVGGTAGAEATPLYQDVVSNGPNTNTGISALLRSVLPTKAFAQTQSSGDSYLCDNGQPPAAGKLVCTEENLGNVGTFVKVFNAIKALPGFGMLAQAADAFNDLVNGALGKLIDFLNSITGGIIGDLLSKLTGLAGDVAGKLVGLSGLEGLLKQIVEMILGVNLHMVSNNMSGGRTFDMVAAGADVSGNDYAHHGIGGVALTQQQVADNLNYQQNQQFTEYKNQSLFAQLTDTASPYSPVAKLALSMPSSTTALFTGINNAWSSFIMNPLGKLANSFASIFTLRTQAAGFIPGKDPFGITQYGYPLDDPVFQQDPDAYWQNYCTDTSPYKLTQAWNEYAANNLNPDNYEPENTQTAQFSGSVPGNKYGTNGCLLIQAAVGSAGAIFTDDVLSAEELATSNAGSGGGGGGPVDCSAPSGVDQSPGTPPAEYRGFIEAAAEGLTCPDYPKPDGAVPSAPGKQYMAYDGCSDNCGIQGTKDGRRYIRVKYRNPPLQGNTIDVFIDP